MSFIINPYINATPATTAVPLGLSPSLWLDAADTTTITASSGSVSQWNDKSGNGRNVTQGTSTAQPNSGTNTMNGLNVLTFDGGDALAGGTTPSLFASSTNPFEVFVVGMVNSATLGTLISQNLLALVTSRQFQLYRTNDPSDASVAINSRGTATLLARTPTTARNALFHYRWNGSVATLADGNTTTSATVGTASQETTAVIKIGSRSNGTTTSDSFFLSGRVAEVIIFSKSLTSSERTSIYTYLSNKWGVAL